MGMFDSVIVSCPSCGGEVEFQSKVGKCELKRYSVNSVPPSIAESLHGDVVFCKYCDTLVKLLISQPIQRVSMIVAGDAEEWD